MHGPFALAHDLPPGAQVSNFQLEGHQLVPEGGNPERGSRKVDAPVIDDAGGLRERALVFLTLLRECMVDRPGVANLDRQISAFFSDQSPSLEGHGVAYGLRRRVDAEEVRASLSRYRFEPPPSGHDARFEPFMKDETVTAFPVRIDRCCRIEPVNHSDRMVRWVDLRHDVVVERLGCEAGKSWHKHKKERD